MAFEPEKVADHIYEIEAVEDHYGASGQRTMYFVDYFGKGKTKKEQVAEEVSSLEELAAALIKDAEKRTKPSGASFVIRTEPRLGITVTIGYGDSGFSAGRWRALSDDEMKQLGATVAREFNSRYGRH